jgi:hypothetical protein
VFTPTCCDTASQPIYWRAGLTFVSFRKCSATPTSRPHKSTLTWTLLTLRRSTESFTRDLRLVLAEEVEQANSLSAGIAAIKEERKAAPKAACLLSSALIHVAKI